MVIQDIVNSCSNAHVAEAAVASIGGAFERRVRDAALRRGIRPGAFAATAIIGFRARARVRDMEALQKAVAGDDQPVLAGFRMIVEPELGESPGPISG
jgi:hypothetical protein